jgi:hypothetical protein
MEATIQLSNTVQDNNRAVIYNSELSHHVKEADLQNVLNSASNNAWQYSPTAGAEIGSLLYRFLNGSGGKLSSLLDKADAQGQVLNLCIDIPFELNSLPFELLYNNGFVLIKRFHNVFLLTVTDFGGEHIDTPQVKQKPLNFAANCYDNDVY